MASKLGAMGVGLVAFLLSAACAVPREDLPGEDAEGDESALASGRERFIHVGGICSVDWLAGKKPGNTRLASFDDVESVNANVDQRTSMGTAVANLVAELDRSCTGEDFCYLHGYSNGAAVISKTLATYDEERWNILWVLNTASNEGGSELSGGSLSAIGDALGVTCSLAKHISPSDHRAGWNHDDTAGNTVYHVGGFNEWWYTGVAPDLFGDDTNDGAVAAHSSAGLSDTYAVPDADPWFCFESKYHYANHETAYGCGGHDLDHYGMAMAGIEAMGG